MGASSARVFSNKVAAIILQYSRLSEVLETWFVFCKCVKIVLKYSDLTELSRHETKAEWSYIYMLSFYSPWFDSPEVILLPLGGVLTDPPAGHIYINLKVSLCVTGDWNSIWGIKKKSPNSTETIREVSCCCRFRNNDIQWAGEHFSFFSWARSFSLAMCSSIGILLKRLPNCGSFSHFSPP